MDDDKAGYITDESDYEFYVHDVKSPTVQLVTVWAVDPGAGLYW